VRLRSPVYFIERLLRCPRVILILEEWAALAGGRGRC
jgi:hypothetical protein